MKKLYSFLVLLIPVIALGQTPTNQDCLGAIPVCQYTYNQVNSFSGQGNYTSEIPVYSGAISNNNCPNNCLLSGEKNDVWYIFTVQTSGNLNFTITPNSSSDDYDWALYNLTNANCSDILTNNSAVQKSCNFCGTAGSTGIASGGNGNCQPGNSCTNFNSPLPVQAGQTYVLNVSNFSSTQSGYVLDFTPSTASIFDNIPPVFQSVNLPVSCGATQLTFNFSENVMCSSVSTGDFLVTGPGGPYTTTNVTGSACSVGGTMENTYTITVSPALTNSGNYQICLTNTAGSVQDACGNLAIPACFSFVVSGVTSNISTVDANCGPNGSATVTPYGGSGSYTYQWSTTPVQTTATASGLNAGTYYVTVSDGACSTIDTATIIDVGGPILSINGTPDYCNQGNGTASVTASGGAGTYTYLWSNSATTATITGLTNGTYSVTVSDGGPCPSVISYNVGNIAGPSLALVSSIPENYGMSNGTATVNATGGTPPINITWLTSPTQTGPTANGLSSGNYTVVATDASGCTDTLVVYIGLSTSTYITVSSTPEHCGLADGTATVVVHNPVGGYSVSWNTIPPQNTETITGLSQGAYTVSVTDSINTYTNVAHVSLAPGPNAGFSVNPNPSTIGDGPIHFINSTTGGTSCIWDFGDGTTSFEQHPMHTYNNIGEYVVTMIASNNFGCKDSASVTVIINDIFTFYIPNAFSPNGDGHNDFFMPSGLSVNPDFYEMRIYDRWGKLIFNSTRYNVPWDGSVNGIIKKGNLQDTYTYIITIKDASQIIHEYRGRVTVLY